MNGEVVVTDDVPRAFATVVTTAFAARPRETFALALSGGSTARRCYERLAAFTDPGDWPQVELFWGDERCVPLDDIDSNHRLAQEALGENFNRVRVAHPMHCGSDGSDSYNRLLKSRPPLDLVHLGLGPDGHTASLFPGSAALEAGPGILVSPNLDPLGRNQHPRMTLTLEGIARSLLVVVTVEGTTKREALRRVFEGDTTAPAALIEAEDLLWIVDTDALGARQPR
jgi:6-phosphogluconolactonase